MRGEKRDQPSASPKDVHVDDDSGVRRRRSWAKRAAFRAAKGSGKKRAGTFMGSNKMCAELNSHSGQTGSDGRAKERERESEGKMLQRLSRAS